MAAIRVEVMPPPSGAQSGMPRSTDSPSAAFIRRMWKKRGKQRTLFSTTRASFSSTMNNIVGFKQQLESCWRFTVPHGNPKVRGRIAGKDSPQASLPTVDVAPFIGILEEHFQKGYRLDSTLDRKRMRRYYEEHTGRALEEEMGEVEAALKSCGVCL